MADIVEIEGFHGTSKELANTILRSGYKSSVGDEHWIGDGVYFFVDDIGSGQQNAKDWAIYKAWNKKLGCNDYPYYGVIKSAIEVEDKAFLDLTTHDGVEVFDYIVDKCSAKLAEIGKNKRFIDGYVINFGRNELKIPIDVVKANEYIRLKRTDRMFGIKRRTPNCTICAVANLATISKSELSLIGRV